jgi:hypothetical protein
MSILGICSSQRSSRIAPKENEQQHSIGDQEFAFNTFSEKEKSLIRLINFKSFKELGTFPRFPDQKHLTCTLDQITKATYENSLIVFVSHCWLRGWKGAQGWDGRPHPDNKRGDKYKLCVHGIEKILTKFAPGMKNCYLWLDFGCIDQDGNPAGELKLLDKIIQVSDCVFTPIHDEHHNDWDYPKKWNNPYKEYQSKPWNDNDYSYVNKGWCRVEMLYSTSIPMLESEKEGERFLKFGQELQLRMKDGRRVHFLYGTKELKGRRFPMILPPLRNNYFDEYRPEKGTLTKEEDRAIISKLVDDLSQYIPRVAEGYEGEKNENGQRHGFGVYKYKNGDIYTGQWVEDKREGEGKYKFQNGDLYEGVWKNDSLPSGTVSYVDGSSYRGELNMFWRAGEGVYRDSTGKETSGLWKNDLPTTIVGASEDSNISFTGKGRQSCCCCYSFEYYTQYGDGDQTIDISYPYCDLAWRNTDHSGASLKIISSGNVPIVRSYSWFLVQTLFRIPFGCTCCFCWYIPCYINCCDPFMPCVAFYFGLFMEDVTCCSQLIGFFKHGECSHLG